MYFLEMNEQRVDFGQMKFIISQEMTGIILSENLEFLEMKFQNGKYQKLKETRLFDEIRGL